MTHLMLTASVVLLALRLEAAEPAGTAVAPVSGWRSLFNGRDLTGWDGDPRMWSKRDGVIHGETTAEVKAEGNTFLICKDATVRDFELKLSFRCGSTNNSGIQYRSKHIPAAADKPQKAWVVRGYQHELRNESKLPDVAGFIYDEGGKRGRICLVGEQAEWTDGAKKVTGQLIDAEAFAKLFKLDDWNEVRIVADGNRMRHFMNDVLTLDFTDAPDLALREGIIALQLHAGAPMWVEFKDISLRETDAPHGN
ncbi:MAG: DUF1080 domain-containing protein [Pirellulales bacterium]